ncbi:MAG: cob(I)yrinic acid a,c-diamide adenosyltransferase, partial [Nitrososphaeraceae archaeon]
KYDIIILDEINYAINLKLLSTNQVLELIKVRPKQTSIVLTGNYAPNEIIKVADLVTEMNDIKHPFQKGIKAKRGIDY